MTPARLVRHLPAVGRLLRRGGLAPGALLRPSSGAPLRRHPPAEARPLASPLRSRWRRRPCRFSAVELTASASADTGSVAGAPCSRATTPGAARGRLTVAMGGGEGVAAGGFRRGCGRGREGERFGHAVGVRTAPRRATAALLGARLRMVREPLLVGGGRRGLTNENLGERRSLGVT